MRKRFKGPESGQKALPLNDRRRAGRGDNNVYTIVGQDADTRAYAIFVDRRHGHGLTNPGHGKSFGKAA